MILEYHEHDLFYSNKLFSGMTHFSLTGSGPTANTVFTWWQAATKQGHNKSYKRHRFGIMQGSIPCLVSYREPQRAIQSWPIRLHSWFCSNSVTAQRAPAKLTHHRMPYDSALILLPHREPQRINSTIEQMPQYCTVYDQCMFTREEPTGEFITEIYIDWFYDSHITEYLCCWFRKSNYSLFALILF